MAVQLQDGSLPPLPCREAAGARSKMLSTATAWARTDATPVSVTASSATAEQTSGDTDDYNHCDDRIHFWNSWNGPLESQTSYRRRLRPRGEAPTKPPAAHREID